MGASEAKLALERLQDSRLQDFYNVLQNDDEFGKQALSAASQFIQTSAQDELANNKHDRSIAIVVDDDSLPNLVKGEGEHPATSTISRFNWIADMSAVDTLEDSLTMMAECLKLWSAMALEMRYSYINVWGQHMLRQICFLDECMSLHLQAILAASPLGLALFHGSSPEQDDELDVLAASNAIDNAMLASIQESVVDKSIDETPFKDLCENVAAFALKSLACHTPHVEVEGFSKMKTSVLRNIRTRELISETVACLTEIGEVPKSDSDVLDQWTAKRQAAG